MKFLRIKRQQNKKSIAGIFYIYRLHFRTTLQPSTSTLLQLDCNNATQPCFPYYLGFPHALAAGAMERAVEHHPTICPVLLD